MEIKMFHSSRLKAICFLCRSIAAAFVLISVLGSCDLRPGMSDKGSGLLRGGGVEDQGKITVAASISQYKSEAVYDDFSDGTSASYDLSVIKIIEPKKYEGIELSVLHDVPASPESVWFKTGAVYLFELDEEIIGKQGITVNSESLTVVGEAKK
jgi:hypothetical protein